MANKNLKQQEEGEGSTVEGGQRILFDVIISITSVDHDGLGEQRHVLYVLQKRCWYVFSVPGRYGDPISPDGDLMTVRDFKLMLKPNGLNRLILSVPIGQDLLVTHTLPCS